MLREGEAIAWGAPRRISRSSDAPGNATKRCDFYWVGRGALGRCQGAQGPRLRRGRAHSVAVRERVQADARFDVAIAVDIEQAPFQARLRHPTLAAPLPRPPAR